MWVLMQQYAVRRNILEKQKDTLITGMINGQVISSVEGATDRIKKMEEYSARLEDVITNHE